MMFEDRSLRFAIGEILLFHIYDDESIAANCEVMEPSYIGTTVPTHIVGAIESDEPSDEGKDFGGCSGHDYESPKVAQRSPTGNFKEPQLSLQWQ